MEENRHRNELYEQTCRGLIDEDGRGFHVERVGARTESDCFRIFRLGLLSLLGHEKSEVRLQALEVGKVLCLCA